MAGHQKERSGEGYIQVQELKRIEHHHKAWEAFQKSYFCPKDMPRKWPTTSLIFMCQKAEKHHKVRQREGHKYSSFQQLEKSGLKVNREMNFIFEFDEAGFCDYFRATYIL